MGFLQPLALLGLTAAAIPALLHLMTRRQPPTVPFPAIRYIQETDRLHSRRLKLRNLLLLVLRTLLIVLVVLAASRPVLSIGAGRDHAPTAVGLVIDNSLSSGQVIDGRSVLESIREEALAVLDRLGPDDRLWIVFADGVPQPVGRIEAVAAIDTLAVTGTRLDIGEAVRAVASALARAGLPEREVVVLSDLQRTALSSGGAPDARLVFWQAPRPPVNHSIDSAMAVAGFRDGAGSVVAWIGGTGGGTLAARLSVADAPPSQTVVRAGDQVVLETRPGQTRWSIGRVSLEPDELRADDESWVAIHRRPPAALEVIAPLGPFLNEAITILREAGRVLDGRGMTIGAAAGQGPGIVLPPADPALVGATNRSLERAGSNLRFGNRLEGEWLLSGPFEAGRGATVTRRHEIAGAGEVLARVGGQPWIVRDGSILVIGSRLELGWTDLPIAADFVPFVDLVVNGLAARSASVMQVAAGDPFSVPAGVTTLVSDSSFLAVFGGTTAVAPLEAGVYFMTDDTGDTLGALAVSHDPRESLLRPASAPMLRVAFGRAAVALGADVQTLLFGGGGRIDLTTILVILAVATAIVELAVATGGGREQQA